MKALITGISGFVGKYLKKQLESEGYEVFGLDKHSDEEKVFSCDITDYEEIKKLIFKLEPDIIFHLAAFSSVGKSWKNPELTFKINVEGTKNIVEASKKLEPKPLIIFISSSEVYEITDQIMTENSPINPISPYAKSKYEAENIVLEYENAIIFRSFNHTGPGQAEVAVCPDFVKQVAMIELGLKKPIIEVGNIDVSRDFSDVRDVVRAYAMAAKKGKKGEIYHVCSGKSHKISWILEFIINLSTKDIKVKIDKKRFRPTDNPIMIGSYKKLKNDTGWSPLFEIEKTLKEMFETEINKLKKQND